MRASYAAPTARRTPVESATKIVQMFLTTEPMFVILML